MTENKVTRILCDHLRDDPDHTPVDWDMYVGDYQILLCETCSDHYRMETIRELAKQIGFGISNSRF